MPFAVTSLDIRHLVREISPLVEDSFVDKVYQGKEEKGEFLLKLRSPRTGKQQLYLKAPEALFLTDRRFTWPTAPPGFCMQLRKHLTNARLVNVTQHGFERIVELSFEKGPERWKLVVELFSKGNVVLVNSEGVIRGVLDLQRWKDRTLRVNAPYEYPPAVVDAPTLSIEELVALFETSKKDFVRFSAAVLGLGGKYAEELVARTGIPKDTKSVPAESWPMIYAALQTLFDAPLEPVMKTDTADAAAFPLSAWPTAERTASFSLAVETLILATQETTAEEAQTAVASGVNDKRQRIIDEQNKNMERFDQETLSCQKQGELIYQHYQELSKLLSTLQAKHATGGWSAVKAYIEERKLPITVDEQKGTLSLDVQD
jgi:predicted ribosome quality control (RQC) complex YloA/Tae2 family protein